MRQNTLTLVLLFLGLLGMAARPLAAQGTTPEQAVGQMDVATGFRVELVAAEPLVRQPVAIDFDDRGRLWVIQYLQYPNPAGLKRVQVDRYSRTKYDRVPEPPPRGPRGEDRLTILEDVDGDGRMDRARDFVSGLNLATGFAFGYGGVFVLQVPYLLFYADRNGDDVPDGDPEVLLEGFGMDDAHSVANSLTWGPDGWLYGCQGSTVTANVRGIEFQQGVWRYHPRRKQFELFCEGGGNSWGLDFDAEGNLFYSTNFGGFVMLHGVSGGYFWKQFGKHGALHNPFAYGYFDHVPHSNFRGGHVTVGGVVYQSDLFSESLRGRYIAADLLGHGVYWHNVVADGSSVRTAHGGELLQSRDTWFAPSDVCIGPEGAVYIADWYDQRTAHPDPDASWDRTNGRIFRVVPSAFQRQANTTANDLARQTSDELVGRLADTNNWNVRRARRLLAERHDATAHKRLFELISSGARPQVRRESLWAWYASGGWNEASAMLLLDDPDPVVRRWAVRWCGEEQTAVVEKVLPYLAAREPDVRVRCELACTAKRLPAELGLAIVRALVTRDLDAKDPYLPLLCWWAVERNAVEAQPLVMKIFGAEESYRSTMSRTVVLPRLVRRLAAEGTLPSLRGAATLVSGSPVDLQSSLLAALEQGLREQQPAGARAGLGELFARQAARPTTDANPGRQLVAAVPIELDKLFAAHWSAQTTDVVLLRLGFQLRHVQAMQRVRELAANSSTAPALRKELLRLLGESADADVVAILGEVFRSGASDEIRLAALAGLARFDDPKTVEQAIDIYRQAAASFQNGMRDVVFSRKSWARRFLVAVGDGRVDPKPIPVEQVRLIALHEDAEMDAIVRKLWGMVRSGTPEDRLAEMRRLQNDLRAGTGDFDRGHALFRKHCLSCHRLFDEGERIGPDLTHANRKDREFLLASLVDPSAVVRGEYASYVLTTQDGRVLTGLIAGQSAGEVTLFTAKSERIVVRRSEIAELREASVSLMPDNLLQLLTPQELRDLFAYLQSAK